MGGIPTYSRAGHGLGKPGGHRPHPLPAAPDTPALAATGVPVHVLYGDQDEIWPPSWYAEEAADLGARESIIRGGTHSPQLQFPQQWAEFASSYWADVESGALVWSM